MTNSSQRIGGAWGQKALAALLDLAQRVRARRQAAAASSQAH
ncbi:MAG TPA: hypothetical protein PLC52_05340 [Anaerolineales bacterium]|nr:hypothetical protein [Anaerolineales bacterium]HRQ92272.1 hypothetical protein [Anaerolineales bacterium]